MNYIKEVENILWVNYILSCWQELLGLWGCRWGSCWGWGWGGVRLCIYTLGMPRVIPTAYPTPNRTIILISTQTISSPYPLPAMAGSIIGYYVQNSIEY
jgi:hypothetical protein